MTIRQTTRNSQPSVHLHIERLILDGLPVTTARGALVQAAVESEIPRLLGADGLSASLRLGGALPSVAGGSIQLSSNPGPVDLGKQIATAVSGALGQRRPAPNQSQERNTCHDHLHP